MHNADRVTTGRRAGLYAGSPEIIRRRDYLKRWRRAVLSRGSVLIHFARAGAPGLWDSPIRTIDYVLPAGDTPQLWGSRLAPRSAAVSLPRRWKRFLLPAIVTKSKILISHRAAWVTPLTVYRHFTRRARQPYLYLLGIALYLSAHPEPPQIWTLTSPSKIFSPHF